MYQNKNLVLLLYSWCTTKRNRVTPRCVLSKKEDPFVSGPWNNKETFVIRAHKRLDRILFRAQNWKRRIYFVQGNNKTTFYFVDETFILTLWVTTTTTTKKVTLWKKIHFACYIMKLIRQSASICNRIGEDLLEFLIVTLLLSVVPFSRQSALPDHSSVLWELGNIFHALSVENQVKTQRIKSTRVLNVKPGFPFPHVKMRFGDCDGHASQKWAALYFFLQTQSKPQSSSAQPGGHLVESLCTLWFLCTETVYIPLAVGYVISFLSLKI